MKAKRQLLIVGAGKLGREVFGWAQQAISAGLEWSIKGFLDDRPKALEAYRGLPPILDSLERYEVRPGDVFLCAVGDPAERKKYHAKIEAKGGELGTLVHPSAVVLPNVEIGAGTLIAPFCHVSFQVRLGKGVFLLPLGNFAHEVVLGDFCQMSGTCDINGNTVAGEGVFVGSHATVLPGSELGDWCYVGAHSLVLRKVKAGERVFGVPAVPVKTPAKAA